MMTALEIHLLGPPQIHYNNQPWPIARRQVRGLLYVLAVDKDLWSRHRLCDLFWPDAAAEKARRALSHLLTHARRALPDPALLQCNPEYVWLAEDVWVDTEAFQRLRLGSLADRRAALALYRGVFLAGANLPDTAGYEMWLLQEQQRWQRAVLEVLSALIEAEASAGRTAQAIELCKQYLALDPLQEEVHVRLMHLYVQAGDRPSALLQYERCLSVLERELGINPSPATRAAYQAILHERTPASRLESLPWTTLPGLQVSYVERDHLLAALHEAYARAKRGSGQVVFLCGEPGIGKSRLIQEFASRQSGEAVIMAGAASAALHPLPYEAITQALRSAIDNPRLYTLAPGWLVELSRLLPEIRAQMPSLPALPAAKDPHAQLRLFQALHEAFATLSSPHTPLILCLDDMHRVDDTTLDWLAYWGARIQRLPVLILLAYRHVEAPALQRLQQDLARYGLVQSFQLQPLSLGGTSRLLVECGVGWLNEEQKQHLWQITGGNPFFILELARTLLERPQLLGSSYDEWPLPQSISQLINGRLTSLSPPAMKMLEAAALLLDFSFGEACAATSQGEREGLNGLDELVQRGLLHFEKGRYRFAHDLTRRVVLDRMSPARRQILHRRVALILAQSRPAAVETIAQHFDAGGDFPKAVFYYERAAAKAALVLAWHTVESIFERMLQLQDEIDPARERPAAIEQRFQILSRRAALYYEQGRLAERDADLQALVRLAAQSGDPRLLQATHTLQARYANLDGDYQAALQHVQRGLAFNASEESAAQRSRLLAQRGFAYYFLGKAQAALQALDAASELSSDPGEPAAGGRIAQFKGYVYYHLAQYEKALAQHRQALDCHKTIADRHRMALDMVDIGIMNMQLLRLQQADTYLQRALHLAREIVSQPAESYALNNLGLLAALRGQFSKALDLHQASLHLQRATGSKRGESAALLYLAQAHCQLGDYAGCARFIARADKLCQQIAYEMGTVEVFILQARMQADRLLARAVAPSALQQAISMGQRALYLAQDIDSPHNQIRAHLLLARLNLLARQTAEAEQHAQQALAMAVELQLPLDRMQAHLSLALAGLAQRRREHALHHATQALDLLQQAEQPLAITGDVYLIVARCQAAEGNRQAAAQALAAACRARRQVAQQLDEPSRRHAFGQRQRALRRWTLSVCAI